MTLSFPPTVEQTSRCRKPHQSWGPGRKRAASAAEIDGIRQSSDTLTAEYNATAGANNATIAGTDGAMGDDSADSKDTEMPRGEDIKTSVSPAIVVNIVPLRHKNGER